MLELIKRNRILLTAAGVLLLLVVILSIRWRQPERLRIIDESVHAVSYPFQATFSKAVSGISDLFNRYLFLVV